MSFKVLQFNMQFGQTWRETDPDRAPIDVDQTIAEIVSHEADLIMIQELERATPGWTQPLLPPNFLRIKQALQGYEGFSAFPKTDERELPFGVGLAIFSRTALREAVTIDVPSPSVEFVFRGKKTTPTDRVLIGATTTVNERELHLMNTHLLAFFMLNSSSETHPEQRKQVVDLMRRQEGPALIAGDFNVREHDSLVRQFAAVGCSTVQTSEPTWRRQPYVLDHIFYNQQLRCISHQVKPTPASDHHVLLAEFEFRY